MAAMRRSTQMLVLGLAVFVIGAGVVILTLGGRDGGGSAKTAATTSTTAQAGTVIIPAGGAPAPSTFTIPENKQAVAVQVDFVPGLAGYAKPGDKVNVYATMENAPAASPDTPPQIARLALASVEVLAVTGPGPGSGTGSTTYLLALDAAQAEQAIFLSRFESVWMTLVPAGQPVTSSTPGRTYANVL